jgi:lipopolysaccharide transport system ATP-binding protein
LLELGAGFHPELTGRENVFVAGIIAGLTREQVARRFSEIVEFAELESFIDNPLRTYSSGMQLRLAFSINVHTSAQVLLIDEVLAVGDLAFQRKCVERIAQFKREGCAILIVSHDLNQIKTVCDRVIWLRDGKIVAAGEAQEVVGKYERAMMAETRRRGSKVAVRQTRGGRELRLGETRWGTMEMQILDVCFLDADDQPIEELPSGQALTVQVLYAPAGAALRSPIFSVSISDTHGTICVDTNTSQLDVPDVDSEGTVRVCFDRLDLVGGEYFVDVGLFATDWGHVYDYQWHVYPLVVRDTSTGKGLVNFPHRWQLGSRADD